jgi:hypothetical protein
MGSALTSMGSAPPIELATCSYREFKPEMGLPIRITRGHPRWRLGYSLAGKVAELAPSAEEWAVTDDPGGFVAAYQSRMDSLGVEWIANRLRFAFPEGRLVLLCFEQVWGQALPPELICHRRAFAEWWESRTGEEVPEVSARPLP